VCVSEIGEAKKKLPRSKPRSTTVTTAAQSRHVAAWPLQWAAPHVPPCHPRGQWPLGLSVDRKPTASSRLPRPSFLADLGEEPRHIHEGQQHHPRALQEQPGGAACSKRECGRLATANARDSTERSSLCEPAAQGRRRCSSTSTRRGQSSRRWYLPNGTAPQARSQSPANRSRAGHPRFQAAVLGLVRSAAGGASAAGCVRAPGQALRGQAR